MTGRIARLATLLTSADNRDAAHDDLRDFLDVQPCRPRASEVASPIPGA
jgi:hypothetical protein